MKRYSIVVVIGLMMSIIACAPKAKITPIKSLVKESNPKNIILLIGDGMGLSQISAGMFANGNKTNLEQFPVIGLHKPTSFGNLITDSAAAATAFACGIKTYNGAIGVDADTIAIRTILEEAETKRMSTGLVASSSIVHATPASFIAHNKYRKNYEEIATDFLKTEVDLIIGGGQKYFSRRSNDDRDLVQELKDRNYQVEDFFNNDISNSDPDIDKNFAFFTAAEEPIPVATGRDYLLPASKLAIDFLNKKQKNGFFLMVEGSQIDWGGHANNSEYVISEFLEFNQIIGAALDFAKADGETLVIVTADHETGGLAIQYGSKMDSLDIAFTSDYHTGTMIPVFAYGPKSDLFSGIFENTRLYNKMRTALGFDLTQD